MSLIPALLLAWIGASLGWGTVWQDGGWGPLPAAVAPLPLVGALAALLVRRVQGPVPRPGAWAVALSALLAAAGPAAAVAIRAALTGVAPRPPAPAPALVLAAGLTLGVLAGLRACRGFRPAGEAPREAVRMDGRDAAPICGICRQPADLQDPRTVRCGRRRDDGRPCVGVYHRDHVSALVGGRCEYCNQPFRERRGGVA